MPSAEEALAANAAIYAELDRNLAARGLGSGALFLNWGYGGAARDARREPPAHVAQRPQWRLVLEALGPVAPDGLDVLDIGCGRGGTMLLLARLFACRSLSGLDIAAANVARCRALPELAAARIQQGDACRLPYRDAAFDLVLNIESSCAYPDQAGFISHAHRVLRPDGIFVLADLVPETAAAAMREHLAAAGFEQESEHDITANVLAARAEGAAAELAVFGDAARESPRLAAFLEAYRAGPGSPLHRAMAGGRVRYLAHRLRRAARPGDAPPPMPDRAAMIAALLAEA